MIQNGVTTKTPQNIPFGAGVYFKGVKYDEKVAPTEEEIKAAIFGATEDGGTTTITPEFFYVPADDVMVDLEELVQKVREEAMMEVSFLEITPEYIKNQVIGKISQTTDGQYDVITSDDHVRSGHFYQGFGYYGRHLDGRPMIIIFKKALCTSGHVGENKPKKNGVFKGTFKCHSDLEYGTTRLPYAIFIRKAEGWTPVNADEVAV